jgi:hypothetical protein
LSHFSIRQKELFLEAGECQLPATSRVDAVSM